MKLNIDEIKIKTRIRQQVGDLAALKESIEKVGLLNPIIVNEDYELISGYRRLEACRQLGWTDIEAHIIDTLANDLKELDIEYHENLGRLDLTSVESEKYGSNREKLLRPPKRERAVWTWFKNLWKKIKNLFIRKGNINKAEQELEAE